MSAHLRGDYRGEDGFGVLDDGGGGFIAGGFDAKYALRDRGRHYNQSNVTCL